MTPTPESMKSIAPDEPAPTSAATSGPAPDLTPAPDDDPIAQVTNNPLKTVLQVVIGLGTAALLLGWVLPWLTHTSWAEIMDQMRRLGWGKAALLFTMMICGLYCYTFTLAASLPGLKHAPALIVNFIGSGVSNAMPGGGAIGFAAQYMVFRSWGFAHRAISTSLIITTIWNMLVRASLPMIAILWLFADGTSSLPGPIVIGALGAVAIAAGIILLGVLTLASDASARLIGHALDVIVKVLLSAIGRTASFDIASLAVDMRARLIGIVQAGWARLTFGVVMFTGIYFFLFRECMVAFGIEMSWPQAFACYALSRVLTLVPLTPGGIGVTELASVLMITFGADGSAAAAAVILFAVYSHILEIPLGLLSGGVWTMTRARYAVPAVDERVAAARP